MTADERRHLAVLAVQIIGSPPDLRERMIRQATSGHPHLRGALEQLVEEAGDGHDPLDDLAEVFRMASEEPVVPNPFDLSGVVIDRYTVVGPLGEGAYGAVYLARRTSAPGDEVALKLLHPGVGSPRVLKRFALERRVLASLDHPGIARFIDAGAAPDGRPYFVMERIEGSNLLDHCCAQVLTTNDRVELLARACDAVQHAHGRGVVHRDLKPGNIMIRVDDGRAAPVVIDFGVARLLDPASDIALTSLGHPIGTRRYMSPEQRDGGVVDARSDVYSLGVTLLDTLQYDGPGSLAADPMRAVASLPKELGWIVRRCCEADPDDRYQSVAELGADLRRRLSGEALMAAPPSGAYRAARVLARHPRLTACAVAALVVVLGMWAAAQSANIRLERELDAQRALITEIIDDVVDEIWVFTGADEARQRLVSSLMLRTDALLSRRPDDAELLRAKARLVRQLKEIMQNQHDPDAMHALAVETLGLYERLAPGRTDDVEFIREHAEAVVRLGDAHILKGERQKSARLYDRAHTMLLRAVREHGEHIGLRDDLCWSYDRLARLAPRGLQHGSLLRMLELATALRRDSPDRPLSVFALQHANHQLGMYYNAAFKDGGADTLARRHFAESVRLGAAIFAIQPDRLPFALTYLGSAVELARLDRLRPSGHGAGSGVGVLLGAAEAVAARASDHPSVRVQLVAAHAELAMGYQGLGAASEASAHASIARALGEAHTLAGSPGGAGSVRRSLALLGGAGLLPGDAAARKADATEPAEAL